LSGAAFLKLQFCRWQ